MRTLSIIIPVFNEERTILRVLEILDQLVIPNWGKEIIVVNDGSKDNTLSIAKKFSENHPCIVISLSENKGKGTAVQAGVSRSTGDFILLQDGDLEYDPLDIPALLDKAVDSKTIVFGSRNLSPETERGGDIGARFGVYLLTKTFNILHGAHLTDIWTAYKLFPKEGKHAFGPGGFESDVLTLAMLAEEGYRFREAPIRYHPRSKEEGKKIRYRDGLKAIFVLIQASVVSFFKKQKSDKEIDPHS